MEKRRRARINHCLNELKSLILEAMKKDVSILYKKKPYNFFSTHKKIGKPLLLVPINDKRLKSKSWSFLSLRGQQTKKPKPV